MPYCTQQNLIDRFGEAEIVQLTDRIGDGVIDSQVLDQAISDAEAEINGYLTAYQLPITNVPANLTLIACDIVRYRLYGNRMIDTVAERYKSAIRYLEKVAAGQISLGPDVAGMVEQPAADGVEYSMADTVFSNETLSDF